MKHKTNKKSTIELNHQQNNDISITEFETIILDKHHLISNKTNNKEDDYDINSNLNLVKIDVKEGEIHIIDTLFWDSSENNEYLTLLCSFKLLKDYLMDHHLSPTIDQINSILLIIIITKRDKFNT